MVAPIGRSPSVCQNVLTSISAIFALVLLNAVQYPTFISCSHADGNASRLLKRDGPNKFACDE